MRIWAVIAVILALPVAVMAAEPAPSLQVTTLAKTPFDLASLKGHVVIVNFWATWCAPCRAEMPMLNAFYQRHHAEGLEIIGISVDSPNAMPAVNKIAATLAYPVALAREATQNGFPAANALPVTYVIDAKGMVKAKLAPDEKGLSESQLDELLRS
jgi:thiol-disulfide isomerase/thioredoxin